MTDIHTGSCLCGAIRFRATGPLRPVVACHCRQCRKTSGHYAAATAVPAAHLTIDEDRGLAWFRASATAARGFCRDCGASLFWKPDQADYVAIFAGSLDDTGDLAVVAHIHCASKGGYYRIDDALPQHADNGDAGMPAPRIGPRS